MSQTLQLVFEMPENKTMTLSVASPKLDLTAGQVSAAMQTIVDQNIFMKDGLSILAKKSARIVDRVVTDFDVV
ncbi:DUF2922 domain-containing protein [Solibacillus sp. CAU 1738]|uniref:DUF2922 domain-containing protein n=1 Tax=Solibacillus sp. CAU 1738 TaxID=3140363 RepID=UPI0032600445